MVIQFDWATCTGSGCQKCRHCWHFEMFFGESVKKEKGHVTSFLKIRISFMYYIFCSPRTCFREAQAGFAVGRGFDSRHLQCYGDVAQW